MWRKRKIQNQLKPWIWNSFYEHVSTIRSSVSNVFAANEQNIKVERPLSMLVTDAGDRMCWWQVWDDGDRFRMLVTDLIHWKNHQHNDVTNITVTVKPLLWRLECMSVSSILIHPALWMDNRNSLSDDFIPQQPKVDQFRCPYTLNEKKIRAWEKSLVDRTFTKFIPFIATFNVNNS